MAMMAWSGENLAGGIDGLDTLACLVFCSIWPGFYNNETY